MSEADATAAVDVFLDALEHLDRDAFVAAFCPDATLFYPHSGALKRVTGHREIGESIAGKFAAARSQLAAAGRTSPPFLGIVPLEIKVQLLGADTAVVTWHVDRGTHGGRRTAVVHRCSGAFRIVSLHSSNMTYD